MIETEWLNHAFLLIAHPFTKRDNNENTMRYEFPWRPQ